MTLTYKNLRHSLYGQKVILNFELVSRFCCPLFKIRVIRLCIVYIIFRISRKIKCRILIFLFSLDNKSYKFSCWSVLTITIKWRKQNHQGYCDGSLWSSMWFWISLEISLYVICYMLLKISIECFRIPPEVLTAFNVYFSFLR